VSVTERQLADLIDGIRRAGARNDLVEVDRLLDQALRLAPNHPLVVNEAALRSFVGGNAEGAIASLEALTQAHPTLFDAWLNLARIYGGADRTRDAIRAYDRVLTLSPANFPALLEKGALQERQNDLRGAAVTYFAALQKAPSRAAAPPALREVLQRAERVVAENNRALESFIAADLDAVRRRYRGQSAQRFDRCVDDLLRKRAVPRQQPTFLTFPALPAIEFYDRKEFPWLADLEGASRDIRDELLDVMGAQPLRPYDDPFSDAPIPQGRLWRSYPFWREGVPFPGHMDRCPRTMKAIAACPNWDSPGIGPNAMFSVLDPGSVIAPHTGTANTRLVAHLGLVIPPECGFRVGAETRDWREGEAFVFDDTIEHEAWNRSSEVRAILIVDVWTPLLTEMERDLTRALCARLGEYYGTLRSEPGEIRLRKLANSRSSPR
jgi:aspartate beta-hydroxylase